MQLDQDERGFSFRKEGPLDMRMDRTLPLTAEEIVNEWPEKKLGEIFRDLGEEPRWKRAAAAVCRGRRRKRIKTTTDLSSLISEELQRSSKPKLHPATLVFQALRICVNRELDSIKEGVQKAISHLRQGGVVGVISFHSLEDKIVKNVFRDAAKKPKKTFGEHKEEYVDRLKVLTKKPLLPNKDPNRRARSAKLRFGEKL